MSVSEATPPQIPPQADVPPAATEAPRVEGQAPAVPLETVPSGSRRDDSGGAPDAPPGAWAIMQKVVPHEQVAWHLEQAYYRVAGFVHRVQDVVDLNTPKLIYESLGLLREDSPFGPDDTEVHVIRWPAYRSGLYRIPFGGQSEEAVRAVGRQRLGGGAAAVRRRRLRTGQRRQHPGVQGRQHAPAARFGDVRHQQRGLGALRRAVRRRPAGLGGLGVIRDGFTARWRGVDYEAVPGVDGEVRLYATAPAEGFTELRPGRFVSIVRDDAVESLHYVRTHCTWRGEPFVVIGEHGGWVRLEYTGGRAPVARRWAWTTSMSGCTRRGSPARRSNTTRRKHLGFTGIQLRLAG